MLAYHKAEQERLTDEMVAGSQIMQHAARAISDTLEKDRRRLDELDQLSGANSASLMRERDRIQVQKSRTCGFTMVVLFICILVLIVFVWMILVIRFSRK